MTEDENKQLGIDLGESLVSALETWAKRKDIRTAAANVPFIGIHYALVTCLKRLSPEMRCRISNDFVDWLSDPAKPL